MTQERDDAIGDALTLLEAVVRSRLAAGDAGTSYVASLAAKGRGKIAQKLGEEATETVIAALTEDDAALTGEAADLVFHLTVLLAERGIGWDAVAAELARRHGISGHAEKAARAQ
ncbi:phosphoribosyl-ATP diphosphatase [Sphingopyxis sp. A083]|uniref:phosphoribosyl-ATP diphosphatase n=1 Tax=Sphingopyxis sp. A083 TaxID=1759083 RepID=UPI0007371F58|nr:phosphoribosyl-ATP diphosphatase [Sphingopyxis sp. A083]KTE75226.1 phosphoribosyl-ATP pyrophosphatase [Sphingopyxis sp. A083]